MASSVQYSVQGEEGSGQHIGFYYTHSKWNEVGEGRTNSLYLVVVDLS